jgi:hypothetical protein
MKVKITQRIIDDLWVRCPDEHGTWRGIDKPGTYNISDEQAQQIAEDCDYQGNITEDWIEPVCSGLTRAYRSLYYQIKGK